MKQSSLLTSVLAKVAARTELAAAVMIVAIITNLIWAGSRPTARALSLISRTRSRVCALGRPDRKMHSACLAAKARPRADPPA